MTIIRQQDFAKFLKSGLEETPIALIHGADEGRIRSRIIEITQTTLGKNYDPLSLIDFDADILNADPPRLLDEINTISMFSDKRVIIVRHAAKLNKSIWQNLFSERPKGSTIILQADELTKSSPLRKAAEACKFCISLICYAADISETITMIEARCKAASLTITPVARAALSSLLGSDYALSEQEVDKLILYCAGQLTIEASDIEALIVDTAEVSGSEPIDCAFEGKLEQVENLCLRSFREGINPAGMVTQALNHGIMLRNLVIARENRSFDTIYSQQKIYFKRDASIRKQCQQWTLAQLNRALEVLSQAQEQGRYLSNLEETITIRALWSVALAARRNK